MPRHSKMVAPKKPARTAFQLAVFAAVRAIPRGETQTYKEVAQAAGYPKAYRAVGSVLKTNYDPEIPCHRVVKSDGTLGEYNRGVKEKERRLVIEGAL